MTASFTAVALVVVVTVAAACDVRSRRIPNWWVLLGTLLALLLRGTDGMTALFDGLLGLGMAFAVTLPFFALGALGGGDAKLLMTVGAFMGPGKLVGALLVIAVLGGIIALLEGLRRGVALKLLVGATDLLRLWTVRGRPHAPRSLASPDAIAVPYGLAIATGSIIWWFWGGALL